MKDPLKTQNGNVTMTITVACNLQQALQAPLRRGSTNVLLSSRRGRACLGRFFFASGEKKRHTPQGRACRYLNNLHIIKNEIKQFTEVVLQQQNTNMQHATLVCNLNKLHTKGNLPRRTLLTIKSSHPMSPCHWLVVKRNGALKNQSST